VDFLKTRAQQGELFSSRQGPFVLYALTHEPERTFFPEALPTTSQFETIVQIASQLRPGQKLLVKEHETQYVPGRRGYSSRSLYFYEKVSKLDNVEVVPSFASSRDLVASADGVVSATGTICLEAALQGKESYYFGFPWWQGFPGTTRVSSLDNLDMSTEPRQHISEAEGWIGDLVSRSVPTTSNIDLQEFASRFALLPEGYSSLEFEALRALFIDFLSNTSKASSRFDSV
jgi:hypothetical protein